MLDGTAGDKDPPCNCLRPDCDGSCSGHGTTGNVQRLHGRGRPADRLGLVRARPRRPDREDEDAAARPAAPSAASSGSSTRIRRTSTRSTSTGRRHAGRPRRSATSARRTTRRSTSASNSGSSYEYEDTDNRLHFYIIDKQHRRRRASCTTRSASSRSDGAGPQTRGVALGRARSPATPTATPPARSRPQQHGRRRPPTPSAHPQDASGVPQQRHLPPVGDRHGHRLACPAAQRPLHLGLRRSCRCAGLRHPRRLRCRPRLGHQPHRHQRERCHQEQHRHLLCR